MVFLSRVSLERSPNCNIKLLIVIPAAAILLKNLYDHTHNYCVQAMETFSVMYMYIIVGSSREMAVHACTDLCSVVEYFLLAS